MDAKKMLSEEGSAPKYVLGFINNKCFVVVVSEEALGCDVSIGS